MMSHRDQLITDLRDLADLLETHPQIAIPAHLTVHVPVESYSYRAARRKVLDAARAMQIPASETSTGIEATWRGRYRLRASRPWSERMADQAALWGLVERIRR